MNYCVFKVQYFNSKHEVVISVSFLLGCIVFIYESSIAYTCQSLCPNSLDQGLVDLTHPEAYIVVTVFQIKLLNSYLLL